MKKVGLFIFTLIILSSFVLAENYCAPGIPPNNLPKIYSGTVSYNGGDLTGTYEIIAQIESNKDIIGKGEVRNGEYYIEVTPCSDGDWDFSFYIGEVKANKQGTYSGISDWGVEESLDLTVNSLPTASSACNHNNIIESGEQCDGTNLAGRSSNDCGTNWQGTISCSSSCRIDYSNCVYNPPANNNGGGSSGGSSGGGGGGGGGGSYTPVTTSSSSNTNKTPISLDNKTSSEETGNNAPITGFSISEFAKSSGGIFSIIGIVTILVIGTAVIISRKKKSKPVENKAEEIVSEVKEEKNPEMKEEVKEISEEKEPKKKKKE